MLRQMPDPTSSSIARPLPAAGGVPGIAPAAAVAAAAARATTLMPKPYRSQLMPDNLLLLQMEQNSRARLDVRAG